MDFSKHIVGKKILITGGTGSFGKHIAKRLLLSDVKEVRIFSRGEDLQHQMSQELNDKRLNFVIGDVRDFDRVSEALQNVDYIFHAAALKQVPDCEMHPFEAVKTNVIGAHNIMIAAERANIDTMIFISTDKAVKPVNAMGMSKALQEKILFSPEFFNKTKIVGVRYGNVVGSRGSVIPLFYERKKLGLPLEVTHPMMTRFWLTLNNATDLVFKALVDGKSKEMFVMKRPACRIIDLAEVISEGKVPVKLAQIRPGEKIHETLVHEDEMRRSIEDDNYYRILPISNVNLGMHGTEEYTSANTRQMNKQEISTLLKSEGWI